MPDTKTPSTLLPGQNATVRLYGWAPWPEAAEPVRALLFGHMVKLALPVMHEYHSDLYHDAHWIAVNVNGATEFDWLVRPSGTNIADSAVPGVTIGPGEGSAFYRVRVFDRPDQHGRLSGDWHATFTHVALSEASNLPR